MKFPKTDPLSILDGLPECSGALAWGASPNSPSFYWPDSIQQIMNNEASVLETNLNDPVYSSEIQMRFLAWASYLEQKNPFRKKA